MSLETFSVLFLLFSFVVCRQRELSARLARAEARVRADPALPLMAGRRLPWE